MLVQLWPDVFLNLEIVLKKNYLFCDKLLSITCKSHQFVLILDWFYLLSHKRGKCIGINGYVALDHSWNCAPMKVIPYNMVNLFGECPYKASNTHAHFETCGRVKRMEMDKHDIKDVIGQTYLEDISEIRTYGVQFASKVKTNHFERIYDILGHGLIYEGSNEDLIIQGTLN